MLLTAEELLAGRELTYDVELPEAVLHPTPAGAPAGVGSGRRVRLRPLTVGDVQMIVKAAREDEVLTSVLMIQKAVVEPALKPEQIRSLHSGLVSFLVDAINRISGLTTADDVLADLAESPLGRAFFLLAREFHWTPDQVRDLTIGQVLGYVELLNRQNRVTRTAEAVDAR